LNEYLLIYIVKDLKRFRANTSPKRRFEKLEEFAKEMYKNLLEEMEEDDRPSLEPNGGN